MKNTKGHEWQQVRDELFSEKEIEERNLRVDEIGKKIMEPGEKIRQLREETGLNRREFAEHFQIPLRTVEEWEAGRRRPPEYIPRLIGYQILYERQKGDGGVLR